MNQKEQRVIQILDDISKLDKESILVVWVGLTSYISNMWPNDFFHVMKNAIINPFESDETDTDFAKIASAVFYTMQHKFLTNPKYKTYYQSFSNKDNN